MIWNRLISAVAIAPADELFCSLAREAQKTERTPSILSDLSGS